ncbi:S1C family serine protease [Halovivax gelatinilyticus]|uniref:S1C family serine protease n=1 Tax=Halovivax gelatinilyticus TaxID=2961597 RepID=UPI0020CA366F|nr:trypsin-like peptidase domain-containing protein [Halovivax gelatinilyticus]
MHDSDRSRRAFLAAAGGGLLATVAGCAEPGSQPRAGRGNSTLPSAIDYDERADGTVYTEIYESVIDSVTMVTVGGIEDPVTGIEGEGQGSAFVLDDYLITNEHVVWDGETVELQYTNGDWTRAEVVGTDVYSDLAVLDVAHRPEVAESLSLSDVLPTVGQEVLAIGNPFGLEGSMSRGIVSGVNRSLPGPANYDLPNVVQTDAGVNPGNSGGPLVDMDGEIVGIINAGIAEGVGFAISAALASRVIPSLIEVGEYEHSRIGIGLREVGPAVATANDLDEATGIIVVDVDDETDAANVLQGSPDEVIEDGQPIPVGGDVIVGLEGEPIADQHALSRVLALQTSPGDVVEFEIIRDGERRTVEVELGARPTDPPRGY